MAKAKTANTAQINYWTVGGFEGNKPPIQALEEAKDMGFEGMELTYGAGHLAPGVSQHECEKIRAAAAGMGMKVETLATGNYWGLSLTHPDAKVRDKAVAWTKGYMQVAKWLGAKTVLVVPGAVCVPWDASQPQVSYANVWKFSTASIKKLLPTATKLGINIGVENVWNWFLLDPMSMKQFVDQFKHPRLGVYFDVGNHIIFGRAQDWVEILGRRIKAVHFKNFQRSGGAGLATGFGDDLAVGDVDWKATLAAFKKINYAGPFTAEMIPFSRGDKMVLPDMELARSTAGRMKQILGRK